MIARIRKLNEDDLPRLQNINSDSAKIILEEFSDIQAYGIFLDLDNLIGFCALSDAEDYSNYKYYTNECKAVSEIYLLEEYNKIPNLYCDLLDFVLNDKLNKDYIIYFDNNINLEYDMYDHLGFESIDDGILVRIPDKDKINEEENNK